MHRVYLAVKRDSGEVLLEGEAHHYVSRVVRCSPGDRLVLFDESGWEWVSRVVAVGRCTTRLAIEQKRASRCEPDRPVWLLQGFPKGTKFLEIVRGVTALGVSGIVPFMARRSVAGRSGKSEEWLKRCQRVALEATRQCGRVRPPEILPPESSLAGALERLASQPSLPSNGVCLWEEASDPLSVRLGHGDFEGEPEESLVVVVGPEGGLTRQEAEQARVRGLSLCHLGPRILRTELAPIVALSILQYHLKQME